ncbi:hypothetical protein [Radicibacter daui]|uniref:hypothetical protein n=1 Tax=Radicibacter daui TaxID=3064829 RepID=UPI004046D1DF
MIPATLRTAYKAAQELANSDPILQIESAVDNRGRLISWATDLGFKRLIESGKLPFDYAWRPFVMPTGRYLQIRLSHSVLTISQVANPRRQPRSVRFRENGCVNNQPFFDFPDFATEQDVIGLPHLLLIHGHQELHFAHLTVPHPEHAKGFRYRSGNLMKIPHLVETSEPAVENTDADLDDLISLKEEIEKWRRDNDS